MEYVTIKILAIDATTDACSIALLNQQNINYRFKITTRNHTEYILPFVNELLLEQHMDLTELNALAFCCGPGSFTGIRITIAIAQGLAFGALLPMISISTLSTLAQGVYHKYGNNRILTAIDAKMGEVYWAEYQMNNGIWYSEINEKLFSINDALMRIKKLEGKWSIAGSGWISYPRLLQVIKKSLKLLNISDIILPTAQDMLPLAKQKFNKRNFISPEDVTPNYLRNKVTNN